MTEKELAELGYHLDTNLLDLHIGIQSPKMVKAATRLDNDVNVLCTMLEADNPPFKRVRCTKRGVVCYGCGDASGQGFGNVVEKADTITTNTDNLLKLQHG